MQNKPPLTLEDRAKVLRSVVEVSTRNKHIWNVVETTPEFTIKMEDQIEEERDWLDLSIDQVPMEVAGKPNEFMETSTKDFDNNKAGDLSTPLLSVEDIGEEAQMHLLDLKTALHQGAFDEEDVSVLYQRGPSASDRLACIADDLSKLPTSQVTRILKAFFASDTSRLLQQDLVLIGRHLIFSHMKHLDTVPGILFISSISEFASRWPQVFGESILGPSVEFFDRESLVKTLNKAFKTFGMKESNESIKVMLKAAVKFTSRNEFHDVSKTKLINNVLTSAEILLSNTNMIEREIIASLCSLYNTDEFRNNRLFAKVTLDSVKKVSELGDLKATLDDLVSTMDHPMKNIIKKTLTGKS